MKRKAVLDDREEGSVRVQFQVQFSRGPKGRQRLREARTKAADLALPSEDVAPRRREAATGPLPRITSLLVLGHRIERMIRAGEFRDLADAARVIGTTRARVTQITNLTLLAPAIQEVIIEISRTSIGRDGLTEHHLRSLLAHPGWQQQRRAWSRLIRQTHQRLSPGVPSGAAHRL